MELKGIDNLNRQITILLLEDDQNSMFYLKVLIENQNIKLLFALNGIEAVDLCNENLKIDIILMDLKLPLLNGFEATRQIRQTNSLVKIITQIAFSEPLDKKKTMDAGCDDFIIKPLKRETLLLLINKYSN